MTINKGTDMTLGRLLLGMVAIVSLGACTTTAPSKPPQDARSSIAAVTQITGSGTTKRLKKSYTFLHTTDPGAQAETKALREREDVEAAAAADVVLTDDNVFKGKARAQAKTTLAHAKLERFATLRELLDTLPSDEEMLSYDPRIDRDTPRVREETRNVGVCAYIYGTKSEADNDYHIIIGDGDGRFMNVEMSGLPETGTKKNRRTLASARDTFESFVEAEGRKTRTYTGWGDPVPVYIAGSLFYDTEHRPGKVGPSWARPKSSWEIHPISRILFEPEPPLCNLQ